MMLFVGHRILEETARALVRSRTLMRIRGPERRVANIGARREAEIPKRSSNTLGSTATSAVERAVRAVATVFSETPGNSWVELGATVRRL
jgi:hypothetical protein